MLQPYLSIILCHMLSCVFDNLLTINVWWWWWWKGTFQSSAKGRMSIVFFSVQSAAGSTLSVRRWKMLDPLFSGLSVGRRSRATGVSQWGPRWSGSDWLRGACPWCGLVIVRVMPCGRENTAYTSKFFEAARCLSFDRLLESVVMLFTQNCQN